VTNADAEITVSPCPYCRAEGSTGAPACDQCRLSYSDHIRYTEAALAHYETHASAYERLASLFAFVSFYPVKRYRNRAIDFLEIEEGDTVLDMGCGTGLSFDAIEKRIGPSGRLIGLDYTEAMLAEAEHRVRQRGWGNVRLVRGDAAAVEVLVAQPVDAVIAAYCLSLVPAWEHAITGVAGLLRPGGRFVLLDWQTTKARGPLRLLSPLVEWMTKRYGLADPGVNFFPDRAWDVAIGKSFNVMFCQRVHFGTTILCQARRPHRTQIDGE